MKGIKLLSILYLMFSSITYCSGETVELVPIATIPQSKLIETSFISSQSPENLLIGSQGIYADCGGGTPISMWSVHLDPVTSECPHCDLDADGTITVVDMRKLVQICICPKCRCE